MKVLWLTNIPSPYRVEFFNELGKMCNLTVLFEKRAADDRDESWKKLNIDSFKAEFLEGKSVGVGETVSFSVGKKMSKEYDCAVVTNYFDPTGLMAVASLKRKKIPYFAEGDGAFAGSGKGIKNKLKKWVFSGALCCFSTGDDHDEYYRVLGIKDECIRRYHFTSLHDKDIESEPVSFEKKQALRNELGLKEEKIILGVGQFIERKGYDILLKAMEELPSNVGCIIIGGKAPEEYSKAAEKFGDRVRFLNFMQKEELNKYYMAADLFVHPTREDIWGLVINEAMAKGLPVVTTDRCVAGLELIKSEDVGKIVPAGDVKALADGIKQMLNDMNQEKCRKVLEVIKPYTFEKMAEEHFKVFEDMILPKRR